MLAYNFEHSTNPKTVDEFANDLSSLLSSMHLMGMFLRMNREGYQVILNAELSGESLNMSMPCAVPFSAHPLKSLSSLPLY